MDRFEYLTKSSEEVEASLILVKRSLCAFLEEDITRLGWRSETDILLLCRFRSLEVAFAGLYGAGYLYFGSCICLFDHYADAMFILHMLYGMVQYLSRIFFF